MWHAMGLQVAMQVGRAVCPPPVKGGLVLPQKTQPCPARLGSGVLFPRSGGHCYSWIGLAATPLAPSSSRLLVPVAILVPWSSC